MSRTPDPPDEWPPAPHVGFVPLDDRLSGRKDTRRLMKLLADQILRDLGRNTWGPDRPLRYTTHYREDLR